VGTFGGLALGLLAGLGLGALILVAAVVFASTDAPTRGLERLLRESPTLHDDRLTTRLARMA